ncbi:MAG: SAM-dependent methyltransferase, partial [Holophaga sp.]|nr:SAM-dependent methyltransferase [Holophaga sp.]
EIVSGVSALQAGAAAAGLSLTHRGLADEFHVLEGHHLLERPRHWASLAQSGATLVLFMATRNLAAIAQKLLAHGASPELPVVLVEAACRSNETTTRSVLTHAATGQISPRTNGPGILYLGATAGLRIPRHVHPDDLSAPAALSGPQPFLRVAGGGR